MNGADGQQQGKKVIAYFSMEVGISHTMPTYSGGLGILAGDTLKSFADIGLPVIGVTLLNEKGYFFQTIDENGWQREQPFNWNPHERLVPLPNIITVHIEGRPVQVRAWKHLIHGVKGNSLPVYFLDTNIDGNTDHDRTLTKHLYGGDRRYRLSQEIILGIGGTRMLQSLGYHDIKKYHMNEGHAALLAVELYKNVCDRDAEAVRKKCVFTTHTPVAAGHDRFDEPLFDQVIGGKDYIPGEVYERIVEDGKVNMTLLGLHLSGHVNGVAKRHGEVSKHMFPGHHIDAITNGIHHLTWAAPAFQELYDKHLPDWRTDPYSFRNALSIKSEELQAAKEAAKRKLINEVNRRTNAGFDHRRFTIGYARRFTTYKRPGLLLFDLERLKRVAENVGDVQVIFAGKAHTQDQRGKELIQEVWQAAREVNAQGGKLKMVFLEHYDMELAKTMIAGCDVWLNNPQRPYEASGTSGMKAALNATPQLSTLDGWWLEGHIEGVTGWKIGPAPKEQGYEQDPTPDDEADELYRKLEETIIPLYYGDKHEWARVMKHCIAINASFFNTYRMVQQYLATTYQD
ncbi:alpha-glucan family phosphorylase [Candidatus Woesearchaeota archaeon]|nr:alpha-glucan family phosphorylase [Candidatus Woesearchaeota archaeon]